MVSSSIVTVGVWAAVLLLSFLIICYLITRFLFLATSFRSGGTWVAKGTRAAGEFCGRMAGACLEGACRLVLPWHREAGEKQSVWSLLGIILWRACILAVSLCVIFGNVPLDILRSQVLYFLPDDKAIPPHLPVDVIVGFVWWAVPGVFAVWLSESVGLIPPEYCLLPSKHRGVRAVCAVLAAAGLAWSLFEGRNMQLYTQCLLVPGNGCTQDPMLAVTTVADFYIPLTVAGLISIAGAILGLMAAFSLLPLGLYCVSSLIQQCCTFTQGGIDGFGSTVIDQLNPRAASPFVTHISVIDPHYGPLEASEPPGALPERSSLFSEPEDRKEPPEPMDKRLRINNLWCDGNLGQQLAPPLRNDFLKMSTLFTVLTISQFHPNRPPLKGLDGSGVEDISPKDQEIRDIRARYDKDEHIYEQAYRGILDRMGQAQGEMRSHGNILIVTDLPRVPLLKKSICDAKKQYPGHNITVLTALPDSKVERGEQNEHIIPTCNLLAQMQNDGVIEGTILLDLLSPAAAEGQPQLLKLTSKIIVALMSAQFHSLNNPPFAEVIQRACRLSPFAGIATASDKIAIGKVPTLYKLVQKAKSSAPERGVGDLNDAVMKSRTATRNVIEQESTLASVCGVDQSQSFFLLYIHPFAQQQKREEFEGLMSKFTYQYANASTITVCANGTVDPNRGNGLYVQVAAVYPLAPELFQKLEQARGQEALPIPEHPPDQQQPDGHVRPLRSARKLVAGGER